MDVKARIYYQHKALERIVLHAVPDLLGRDWLPLVHVLRKLHVEAKKVDQLARGIDFSLEGILGLANHGCSIDLCAERPSEQVGGLECEDKQTNKNMKRGARKKQNKYTHTHTHTI